jgi:predicted TIM-barrel fold metal-dependent hydrolase
VLTNPLLAPQIYTESTFTALGLEIIEATGSLQDIVERNAAHPDTVLASFRWRPGDRGAASPEHSTLVERLIVQQATAPRHARQSSTADAEAAQPAKG